MDLHNLMFEYDAKLAKEIQKVFGECVVARLKLKARSSSKRSNCLQFHLDRRNLASTLFRMETIRRS